jgi:hypothetical protein
VGVGLGMRGTGAAPPGVEKTSLPNGSTDWRFAGGAPLGAGKSIGSTRLRKFSAGCGMVSPVLEKMSCGRRGWRGR